MPEKCRVSVGMQDAPLLISCQRVDLGKVEATQASPYRHNTGSASSYSTPFQEAPRRGGRTLVTRNTPSGQYTVRLERTMMETDGVEAPR